MRVERNDVEKAWKEQLAEGLLEAIQTGRMPESIRVCEAYGLATGEHLMILRWAWNRKLIAKRDLPRLVANDASLNRLVSVTPWAEHKPPPEFKTYPLTEELPKAK